MMQLFYHPKDHVAHRIALVAEIKDVPYEAVVIEEGANPEDLDEDLKIFNPELLLPAIKNKEIILAGQTIVVDYLEERYPYPPLYPLTPVDRAQMRWMQLMLQTKLGRYVEILIHTQDPKAYKKAKEAALDYLQYVEDIFTQKIAGGGESGEELKLIDCVLIPILWRMILLGVEFPKAYKQTIAYCQRMKDLEVFQKSLPAFEQVDYKKLGDRF